MLRRACDQNHYGDLEARRKSQEAGFDRHLVKPIGRATLEELVKSAAGA